MWVRHATNRVTIIIVDHELSVQWSKEARLSLTIPHAMLPHVSRRAVYPGTARLLCITCSYYSARQKDDMPAIWPERSETIRYNRLANWKRKKIYYNNFWHPGTLTLSPEHQSAPMSKITNGGLTRSGTECFIAVPVWQQWALKG